MTRAGRRRSVVWTCFVENAESGKRRVLCRFCQHDIVANPIRMVRHIVKYCPNADEEHKKICRDYQTLTIPARRRTGGGENGTAAASAEVSDSSMTDLTTSNGVVSTSSAVAALTFGVSHGVDDTAGLRYGSRIELHQPTPAHQTQMEVDDPTATRAQDELVLGLLTSESSLALLENAHFRSAIELLRPHFTVPSVQDVSSSIVPRLRSGLKAETDAMLRTAAVVTAQATTWTERSTVELHVTDQDHRHTLWKIMPSDRLTEVIGDFIRQVAEAVDVATRKPTPTVHLCIDAFGPLSKTLVHELLRQADPNHGILGRCMIQTTLLLLHTVLDSIPSAARVIENCASLMELGINHPDVLELLQLQSEASSAQARQVSLDSIWSAIQVVDQVARCRSAFVKLGTDTPDSVVAELVRSERFWQEVKFVCDIMRPFGYVAALSEIGQATASLLMTCHLLVHATVGQSSIPTVAEKEEFERRFVIFVQEYCDEHALACLVLDPRTRGIGLSAVGKRKARGFIVEILNRMYGSTKQSQLVEHLVKYLNHERPFDDETSWQMMAPLPRLFWMEFMSEAPALAAIALAVLAFRPFVHPLEATWKRAISRLTRDQPVPSARDEYQDLRLHSELANKQTDEHRKLVLDVCAPICHAPMFNESVWNDEHTMTDDSITTTLPSEAFQELLSHLRSLASPSLASPPSEALQLFDSTWIATSSFEDLHHMKTCLHRALFGEDVRSESHYEASVPPVADDPLPHLVETHIL
ncbi:hypothetical protein Poli38472_012813 [Pythium oligandrum]|uniref:BED-type domain-containing protein n=1 Tax=Pythium oligandrum TaxID=41045 RepID=A0A8K1CIG2_PYTOL|nr:hypothetical protein Poli38472_012813 [Pythium oligandrum]|eukprot:TMW64191.1 hypothetical protein Poli38472_012813 [Pythium oligandrum]